MIYAAIAEHEIEWQLWGGWDGKVFGQHAVHKTRAGPLSSTMQRKVKRKKKEGEKIFKK